MSKIFHTRILTILIIALGVFLLNSCKKEFNIMVQCNNEAWGSVTGSGTYVKGTVIQLQALPNSGYQFDKWDDENTDNPRYITVEKNATYTAVFVEKGGSGGEEPIYTAAFSVSITQKVLFSPGNLQWSATNGGSTPTTHAVAGGGTVAGTWRFAPNQWDMIGYANSNVSSTYTGWIDLFGWGTSGYNNKHPYMTSTRSEDYVSGSNNISGTNYDWGVFNAIYNPKTNTTDAPGIWRTLTKDEWYYLIFTRTTLSGIRYAKAIVNGVEGLIIVPDNWSSSIYTLADTNNRNATYSSNLISATHWANMEAASCLFLPAAGGRGNTSISVAGGHYWSSTGYNINDYSVYYLDFCNNGTPYPNTISSNSAGISVRLVKDVK